jgi:CheY-like chemotaxis protein
MILTTSSAEADILRSYQLHANCFITKPVDLNQFLCGEKHRQLLVDGGQTAQRTALMSEKSTQVLLVEDNPGDARLMHEMLNEPGPGSFELTRVGRWSEALIHLASSAASVVLLDLGLPDVRGLDVVRRPMRGQ